MRIKLLLLMVMFFSCNCKKPCETVSIIEFRTLIQSVQEKVVDLTWLEEPLTYPEFHVYLDNAHCYQNVATTYIQENEENRLGIEICLLGLRNLDYKSTLEFSEKFLSLNIDEQVVANWILGIYGNKIIYNSSNDIFVKELIENIEPKSKVLINAKKSVLSK